MKLPLAITFLGRPAMPWIEEDIRARAARLEEFSPVIMSCRVVVDVPHRHHERGNRFQVRIDLTVPGEEIAVTRDANLHGSRKDLGDEAWVKQFEVEGMRKDARLVIRQAFDIARRRLQEHGRRHRLDVKTHEPPPHGRVVRWHPDKRFGMIEAADGHEVFFHENSVLGAGLKRLRVGCAVAFVEEAGEKGPQATTVRVVSPQRVPAPA